MKKIIYSFAAVALLLAATLIAKTQTETFTANNNYNGSVGTVTINYVGGPSYLGVTSQGQFQTSIEGYATSVVINGQTVNSGVPATVTLPNSDKIDVSW